MEQPLICLLAMLKAKATPNQNEIKADMKTQIDYLIS
jgi:hypothetical protein